MSTYAVLLPGDENAWAATSDDEKAAVYARHEEFQQAMAGRGHRMTGGAELAHSREAKVVRSEDASSQPEFTITDGPYAETTEQLTGFYLVETDDLDDLLEVIATTLGRKERAIEVRQCLGGSED
jgi:hypothetical protein